MSDQPGWAAPDEGAQPGGYPRPDHGSAPGYDAAAGQGVPPGSEPPPGYAPPGYPPPAYGPPPGQWSGYGTGYDAPYGSPYAAAPAAYAGYAAKPGVVALRPLGIGEILDGAVSTVRSNWKVLLGSAALIAGAYALISFLLDLTVMSDLGSTTTTYDDSGIRQVNVNFNGFFALVPTYFVQWFALLVLAAVCAAVVGRAVLGERPTWEQAWALTRPHLLKLLGVGALTWLALAAGFLLCGIGEIYPWVVFSLAVPALVLERGRVTGSLGRSFSLVKGAWWRTFWILLLGVIIQLVISFAISVPLLLISGAATGLFNGTYASGGDVTTAAVSALAAFLGGVITWPFLGCLVAVIYVDRRIRTEGLDLELQRAAGVAPPAPTYQAPTYQAPAYQAPTYQGPPAYPAAPTYPPAAAPPAAPQAPATAYPPAPSPPAYQAPPPYQPPPPPYQPLYPQQPPDQPPA